jgi:diguanylate cyclase (GGDEF)-like protein
MSSTASPKQQVMIARQQLDKLAIFITSLIDFFQGANPKVDAELKQIKKLLAGKPDYQGAGEISIVINSQLKHERKFMQQKRADTLTQIEQSLRSIAELEAVPSETKQEIKTFLQSLAPEKGDTSSPVAQFEQALKLFRQALSNNAVMQSQESVKQQKELHYQITQELQELLTPYYTQQKEDKRIIELRKKLNSGLEHSELLECCLAMIRFVIRDVMKEASAANRLIHDIHGSLGKINVGIKSTIATSKSRLEKRSKQNERIQQQIAAIEASLSDSKKLEDLKIEAQTHLNKMQSSIRASEADEIAEQEKMISLLETMQKRITELETKADSYKQKLIDQRVNSMTDSLTKLPNRMAYEEKVDSEYAKQKRTKTNLCMALIDIDHFKKINDSYGHSVGDKTLQIIASQIKKHLAPTDFVARWGGEEFVALLPNTELQSGFERLEVMREKISGLPFMFKGNRVSVTVSIGLIDTGQTNSIEQAFESVDALLYEAKQNGRNQTIKKDA